MYRVECVTGHITYSTQNSFKLHLGRRKKIRRVFGTSWNVQENQRLICHNVLCGFVTSLVKCCWLSVMAGALLQSRPPRHHLLTSRIIPNGKSWSNVSRCLPYFYWAIACGTFSAQFIEAASPRSTKNTRWKMKPALHSGFWVTSEDHKQLIIYTTSKFEHLRSLCSVRK